MMENIPEITSAEQFEKLVLQADVPVVVTFYADWCGDCRRLCPHLAAAADEYRDRISFARVEDSHRDLEEKYGVHLIPDVMIFVDREIVRRWVNVTDISEYRPAFDAVLSGQRPQRPASGKDTTEAPGTPRQP